MFFQILPVIHKKNKPEGQKKTEDEESKVEILSLAPFTPNPKIVFDDVAIGTTQTRKLLIKNPSGQDINVFITKTISEDMNLVLSWNEAKIEKDSERLLEMIWSPVTEKACRQSFTLSDGKRISRDVAVTFRSFAPKKVKATGTKSKSKQTKSPVKISLSRKAVSPAKKLKQQRKSPSKYPIAKKKSPVKYHSPSQKCQKESFLCTVTKEFTSKNQQSHAYQNSSWSEETFNFLNKLSNKENMSPSYQQLLSNVSASFTSPSNATFLMEMKNEERRDTYTFNPISERRETYTMHVDKRNCIETRNCFDDATNNFTIENIENSSNFSDSLESPSKTLALREKNIQDITTPTLGSLLNRDAIIKPTCTPNFEYKLKILENFAFSPTVSPYTKETPKQFQPTLCSTSSKPSSVNNSHDSNGTLSTELFPPISQSFHLNESNETYTQINISSNTYTKGNQSFDTYIIGNISTGTYVKDNSVGDIEHLEVSPVSKTLQNSSPVPFKQKSFEISPILEANKNIEARRVPNLSSIAEESCVFSESVLRIGSKRKKSDMNTYPSKREKPSPEPNKNWSKKGGTAYRIAKSTSGLKLDKSVTPLPKIVSSQQLLSFKETNVKSVIVQNPFLYASIIDPFMASQVYCDEEWINQQEILFRKWLNALLTPPKELNAKNEVDVALVWQECKKKYIPDAPTKDSISLNFHTKSKLDYLRKQAQNLFRSKEISNVLQKVCLVVETGKLSIREDKDLHLNLKLKSDIMGLILSYNPLWLRIGLETIYNEIIPLKSNSDTQGLASFILERFLKDPHLIKKHKTLYSPKYSSDLKKFLLKKFLILVYFLDQAKNGKLIQHDPCLFCKNATEKESKLVLTHFARETLSAVGDITKYLKCLGYVVTHVQSYIHEFDYAVKNLGVDLRDGVRLARVMEIIQMRSDLTNKLRVPAISRLQKVHNMQLVFNSLNESGYDIQYDICAKDIVDGHKEKTLSFLWQIIYKFEAPLMVTCATTIQTWFRSLPIVLKRLKFRRIYERRNNAAKRIQGWYKRQKLSKFYFTYAKLLKEHINERKQERAATKIQNFFKMVICRRKYLIQFNAITKVQAYARGWLIRHNYRRRIIAAKIIQKSWRGYVCRKKFVKLKMIVTFIQKKFRAKQEMMKQKLAYENLKVATINIQRIYRANREVRKCRQYFIVHKVAVIKIQSFYKMYTQRKQFIRLLNCTRIIQVKYRAQVAMRAERFNYLALKNATLTIQRRFRARLKMNFCRKEYLTKKNASVKIQTFYRMYVMRKYFLQLRTAVKVLQIRYRANISMKVQRLNYLAVLNATLCVQKVFRSYLKMKKCREEFLKLKRTSVKIQRRYRAILVMRELRKKFVDLQNAAVVVQRRYRAKRATKIQRLKYLKYKNAVTCIQRRYRAIKYMQQARAKWITLKRSTIFIQRCYRATKIRNNYTRLRNAAIIIQRRYRAQKLMIKHSKEYRELRRVVFFVQQKFRANIMAKRERARYLNLRNSVLLIQQQYRANILMEAKKAEYIKIRNLVVMVQRKFRAAILMRRSREQFLKLKNAAVKIQRHYRTTLMMRELRKQFIELQNATVLIQRRYRARKAAKKERLKYQKVKNAVYSIQRWYRALKYRHQARTKWIALKRSTVFVQRYYRAKKQMIEVRNTYKRLRNAAVRIQRWYSAQKLMTKYSQEYRGLRRVVCFVQQKFRAKQDRARYLKLRKSALLIQQQYRAQMLMKTQRAEYIKLKKLVVMVQRKFRATILMRKTKNQFLILRTATVLTQRRYRATRAMTSQSLYFKTLKKVVILMQRKFRANKLAQLHRSEYLKLKNASVVVQRRYRAKKSMLYQVEEYSKIRLAALIIQCRYRAKKAMRKEVTRYQQLRLATLVIQRRWRATILCINMRQWFLKFTKSIRTIQEYYRAYLLMKKERKVYLLKHKTVIHMQRLARGYLVRKKYSPFLTPEAIEARRVLKIQTTAAVKIQAIWRGYSVRKSSIPVIVAIRKTRQENQSKFTMSAPGRTLAQRCEMAMLCMVNENSSLLMVIRALEDLDFITRHCRDSCIRLSLILPNQLYIIISSAARSLPEMDACNMAAFILINFYKYPRTRRNSWNPEYIDAVINVLVHCCDKEAPLFSTLCTLLWLFCHEKEWREVILGLSNIGQRIHKIDILVHRKQNMVIKSKKVCSTSVFAPVMNMKLPSRDANWGLDYNRPNTFRNAVFALTNLMNILDI